MSEIPDEDLKIEAWPPREKGGQHVALTASGLKITHLPSGIEASVNVGRSQHINRMIAMDMIYQAITHPRFK